MILQSFFTFTGYLYFFFDEVSVHLFDDFLQLKILKFLLRFSKLYKKQLNAMSKWDLVLECKVGLTPKLNQHNILQE